MSDETYCMPKEQLIRMLTHYNVFISKKCRQWNKENPDYKNQYDPNKRLDNDLPF